MFLNHEAGGARDPFGPRLLYPARLGRDSKIPLPFVFGQTHPASDFHQSNENAIVVERVALGYLRAGALPNDEFASPTIPLSRFGRQ